MVLCKWTFNYDTSKFMDGIELTKYQKLLLNLRKRYQDKVENLSNCSFYDGDLPPTDNIFGTFLYNCKRHSPKCKGWYLIWDPNSDVNRNKLTNFLNNKCATWEYKAVSKRIQYEIAKQFPDYFEYVDDDDTHPYYIDSFYSLNNSTRSEEELFEDLDDSKSSVSFLSTSYTPPSSLKHL